MYNPDTGWTVSKRGPIPVERPANVPPPCNVCPKGPKPYVNELSTVNIQAFGYSQQCKVDDTHLLPRDALVVRNNALIRAVEDGVQRYYMARAGLLADIFLAAPSVPDNERRRR